MSHENNPPAWVKNEPFWRKQYKQMVARAYDLIQGRLTLIPAARELAKYKLWLRLHDDKNISLFDAIRSGTSHLPVGEVRKFWAKDALEIKDREIANCEKLFHDQALTAARNLIEQYETIARPISPPAPAAPDSAPPAPPHS